MIMLVLHKILTTIGRVLLWSMNFASVGLLEISGLIFLEDGFERGVVCSVDLA